MNLSCLKGITVDDMAQYISSTAVTVYNKHIPTGIGEKGFSKKEQLDAYQELLKELSNAYGGDITTVLNQTVTDRVNNKGTEKLLLNCFKELNYAVDSIKNIDKKNEENLYSHTFLATPLTEEVLFDSFKKYIVDNPRVKNDIKSNGEVKEEPILGVSQEDPKVDNNPVTISKLLKSLLGTYKEKYSTDVENYLSHTVADTWIDGRVQENGKVIGFTGILNTALRVKSKLQTKVYNFYTQRANATFSKIDNGETTRYLVFEPGREPVDYIEDSKLPDGITSIGYLPLFRSMSTDDGQIQNVKVIITNDIDNAPVKVQTEANVITSSLKNNTDSNFYDKTDYLKILITNPDELSEQDLPVFYAHILTTGNNYDTFLGAKYKPLSKVYKERYKSSGIDEKTVSGEDQDNAVVKMHKLATPRLSVGPTGDLTANNDNPYLTVEDFLSASEHLPFTGSDKQSIAENVKNLSKTAKSDYMKSVYLSIYHRFFADEDYSVDGILMRSYNGIIKKQGIRDISVEEYEKSENKHKIGLTKNAMLEDSLSSLITSFRSTVINDQSASRNGRFTKTDIAGRAANLNGFYTNFTEKTTDERSKTKGYFFYVKGMSDSKERITVSAGKEHPNGPRALISLLNKDGESKITYTVDINIDTQKKSFPSGIPVTIVNKSKDISINETADLFSQFGLPQNITNVNNLPLIVRSIKESNLQNEKNYGNININVDGKQVSTDVTLDNLYINMVFSMILNGDPKYRAVDNLLNLIGRGNLPEVPKNADLSYNPTNIQFGYNNAISDIMVKTGGELGPKRYRNFSGNQQTVFTTNNYMKRLSELAANVDVNSINAYNPLTPTNLQYKVRPGGTYIKGELKVGDDVKSLENFTEKENLIYLIENAYLQTAKYSRNHNTVIMEEGVQADRLHVQWTEFEAIGDKSKIFVKNDDFGKINGWSKDIWKSDKNSLLDVKDVNGNTIPVSELNAVDSFKQLKALLELHSIKYKVLKPLNIINSGRLRENIDGNAYIPKENLASLHGLDIHELARKAMLVHQNYYKGLERVNIREWNKALGTNFTTLQEVANDLISHPKSYDLLKSDSSLVDMSMIAKKNLKLEDGTTIKAGVIPEDVLQSIAIFSNDTLAMDYIEEMKKMFLQQIEDADYKRLSSNSIDTIKNSIMNDKSIDEASAKDILFNSYFYNHQILANSALNIHTGGVTQFSLKTDTPLLNTEKSFTTDGKLNTKSIVDQIGKIKVPGSKGKILSEISVDELLSLRDQSQEQGELFSQQNLLDRLSYLKVVLENNISFPTEEDKAKALLFNDFTRHTHEKFVSQLKRNAVLGTSGQLPRIIGDNEPGCFLCKSSKTVTIRDADVPLHVLGLSGGKSVDGQDGSMEFHPLFAIKLNNSIGNDESSFKYEGAAIKGLTIETDSNGSCIIQKKAENGANSNDLLKKGSIIKDIELEKANTAIEFSSKNILVDRPMNVSKWEPITEALWKNHGLSYGWLKYTDEHTGVSTMKHSYNILQSIKTDQNAKTQFIDDLSNNRYYTDKIVKHFNNLQELWEYYGASTNDNAWNIISDILGTHSGINTMNTDLSDAVYPLRSEFIEKFGFTSQEKTGSKNIISWENWKDPNYKLSYTDESGLEHKRYSDVSNNHYLLILQAEHNYDTTSSHNKERSADNQDQEDNQVSVISQIISACIAEGMSVDESMNISNTLGALTDTAIDGINNKIAAEFTKNNPSLKADKKYIIQKLETGDFGDNDIDINLKSELQNYLRNLAAKSLASKQDDPGLASELLSEVYKKSLTFDQKQLLPLIQSQVFAEFNKKAVRLKFAGGQFIITSAHEVLPTYNITLGGNPICSGITREEINKYGYGNNYSSLASTEKNALDEAFKLSNIENLSNIKLSDMILCPDKKVRSYVTIKNQLRDELGAISTEEFNKQLFNKITNSEKIEGQYYQYRFGNVKPTDEKPLEWMHWFRYGKDGNRYDVKDSDEFKSFDAVNKVAIDYKNGKTFYQSFGIREVEVNPEPHPTFKTQTPTEVLSKIPKGLIREYYFSKIDTLEKRKLNSKLNPTDLITPAQNIKFENWLVKADPLLVAKNTYEFIAKSSISDQNFKNKLKMHLYNLLQDDSNGKWVSSPAEMYMPHMQTAAFLLKETDSLNDITKMKAIPSTDKLESLGIIDHNEAVNFSFNFDKANNKFREINYNKLSDAEKDMYNEYCKSVTDMRINTNNFFNKRIKSLYKGIKEVGNRKIAPISGNLFSFSAFDYNTVLREAKTKRNQSIVNGSHYNIMTNIIEDLQKEISAMNEGKIPEKTVYNILTDNYKKFIDNKTAILSDNFFKTLDFITARIPGPAKQTFTHGRIKNFIYSAKNSVYGPPELQLLAGLDFDIDKQNMMTWSVDNDGEIVPWSDYMVNGKLSSEKLTERINNFETVIRNNYTESINEVQERLNTLTNQLSKLPENGEDVSKLKDKINVTENALMKLNKDMESAVADSDHLNRIRFMQAGQNFIVHNLIQVISNPKNAIEASVPTSTEKVRSAVKLPKINKLFTSKVGIKDLLIAQKITNGINPYSIPEYEKITMAGKSGIGINASDIKAYYALYYATVTSKSDEEKNHVVLKSDLEDLHIQNPEDFGIDKSSLQFFKQRNPTNGAVWNNKTKFEDGVSVLDGKRVYTAVGDVPAGTLTSNRTYWKLNPIVISSKVTSNAEKWTSDGVKISDQARFALTKLKTITGEKEQVAFLSDYIDKVNKFNSMNVERQAWVDMSELLNAATDNAKEMILGKIGVNSTTNSIVSTMIRLGVNLEYALDVINSPEVTNIITQIDKDNDMFTKSEQKHDLTAAGIITQDTFAARLADRLDKETISVPGSGASQEEIYDYLINPIRLLKTYTSIASEFSTLSKLLSINQGLKNSAFEVLSYTESINSAINKWVSDYAAKHNGEDVLEGQEFDLRQFVKDVKSGETKNVDRVLNAMDKVRHGVNVPYVLLKNAHYFSYFRAMFQAKTFRDSTSNIEKIAEDLIKSASKKNNKRAITLPIYNHLKNTLYDFGVSMFLKDKAGSENQFTLQGLTYNLSLPKGDGNILGRMEFMENTREVIDQIRGNAFVDSLKLDKTVKDDLIGTTVKILKGIDLNRLPSEQFIKLKDGLNKLDPELCKALFYYGLIATKGSYGGGSFIGLYDINDYLVFESFLKDKSKDILQRTKENTDLIININPLLLPQVRTIPAKGGNQEGYGFNETEENPGFVDESCNYDANPGDELVYNEKDLKKYNFTLDHLNSLRRNKNSGFTSNHVRSIDNGLTYAWNNYLQIWVPQTREVPESMIQFTIPEPGEENLEKHSGWIPGWEVNLPDVKTVKGPDGKMKVEREVGHVLSYITNTMKGDAFFDNPQATNLADLLKLDRDRIQKGQSQMYIVQSPSNDYRTVSKEELLAANPGYEFDENQIKIGSKSFENIQHKVPYSYTLYEKDKSYYKTPVEGAHEIGNIELPNIASSASGAVYDEDTVKKLIDSINEKSGKIDNYDIKAVDNNFNKYSYNLLENLLLDSLPDKSLDDIHRYIEQKDNAPSNVINLIDNFNLSIQKNLGDNPSTIKKLIILHKGYEEFTKLYRKILNDSKKVPKLSPEFELPKTSNIPKAGIEILTGKTAQNDISMMNLEEFKALTDMCYAEKNIIEDYIKKNYLNGEGAFSAVKFDDNLIYLPKGTKISLTRQITDLEKQSKEIIVPSSMKYEYSRPVGKEVLITLTKFLNNRLPGVKWLTLNDAEIKERFGNSVKSSKGFFKTNGVVVINTDKATLETPLHEFTHVYLQYLAADDPEEYSRLMNLTKQHQLFSTMKKSYKNISDVDVAEETFCELLSMQATNQLLTDKSDLTATILNSVSNEDGLFGRMIKVFKDIFKGLFGKNTEIDLKIEDTLGSVINKLSDDILFGKDSMLSNFGEDSKLAVQKYRNNSTYTVKEAKDILFQRGYISWYCI